MIILFSKNSEQRIIQLGSAGAEHTKVLNQDLSLKNYTAEDKWMALL